MERVKHLYIMFIMCVVMCTSLLIARGETIDINPDKKLFSSHQRKNVEWAETRQAGKYKVVIKYKDFDKTKHKLTLYKRDENAVMRIDNQKYYGTDGAIPRREISSISFFDSEKEYRFPPVQYNLLFNALLEEEYGFFSVKEHLSHIEIDLKGGDGHGSYEVKWLVFKKNMVVKRYLSDIEIVEQIKPNKKPLLTVSRLENVFSK